ncbi:hypothetical protein [Pseudomonas serbica]|uniref:hypothetical protein n=1 Tax=Pseudomonas serbica TaxID=2965074 RepID=UPI00237ACF9E|nr:hypothetical protein [Pseudomonas serbica]
MTEDLSPIAREKLTKLILELNDAATKLNTLSMKKLPKEDLVALGGLNDRVAVYLQDIVLMLADTSPLHIEAVMEFIGVVENCVDQIAQIEA